MSVYLDLKDDRSEKIQYDSPDYPIYIRRGFLSGYPNYAAPVHWHDDIELIFILDGEMTYNVNGTLTDIKCSEGIFINSRQLHFGYSPGEKECDFICILLHPMLLCAIPETESEYVLPITGNPAYPYIHLEPSVPWQNRILTIIQNMYLDKGTAASHLKIQADFFELWSLLYENIPASASYENPESPDLTITKNMVGFIQKNYVRKISLADIAAAGSVGQSKCCKLFARYFEKSPIQYLNLHRLNKSIELLMNTSLSVTEIALGVGFGSGSYYTETFRRWLGETPSEYRAGKKQPFLTAESYSPSAGSFLK